ncbi:MAG: hypothetical protein R3D55_01710 [Chloroflexota bacterium]
MAPLSTIQQEKPLGSRIWTAIRAISPIYVVLILLLIAIGTQNPAFLEPSGILNLLRRAALLMILTAGQLFVIVAGGFDLSVGSIMSLTVIGASLLINNDQPTFPGGVILVLFGIGIVAGVINGTLVSYFKVALAHCHAGHAAGPTRRGRLYWTGGAPRGYLTDNFRAFGRGWLGDALGGALRTRSLCCLWSAPS